jgi:predicted enzyme related to lactoylglutathione lyase
MAASEGSFIWYELMSTDIGAAKVFYRNVVGWNTQDMPMPDMTYTVLEAQSTGIGGMMPMPKEACDAGMNPCWVGYITVDDVDAAADKVKRLGGTIRRPPSDIPTVGRFAAVADPQGAVFHLFKPGRPGERVPSDAPGNIGWHELHTTDAAQGFEFYKAMFGWQKGESVDMGPMGAYQLFTIRDAAVGGMMNSPIAKTHPFWLYYVAVGDIDAAAARVTDNGGKISNGPHPVPGGAWVIQATDPQGASFALVGTKK